MYMIVVKMHLLVLKLLGRYRGSKPTTHFERSNTATRFVIVVFPDHTHLLFLTLNKGVYSYFTVFANKQAVLIYFLVTT